MSNLPHLFESLIAEYGVAALFASVTLESLGAPLPGESAVMVSSAAAARGVLDIRMVVLAAVAGSVLGDNIGYLIGRRYGRGVLTRYGGRIGITDANLDRAEAVARSRGPVMVVFARFVVLLRQLNGIVAGTTGMAWPAFLIANTIGAVLWVGVWSTLAYHFGHSATLVPLLMHHLGLVAAIVVPLLIVALAGLHYRMRHRA